MFLLLAVLGCAPTPPPVEARMLYGSRAQVRLQDGALHDLGACAGKAEKKGEAVGGPVEVELHTLQGQVLAAEATEVPGDSERLGACIEKRAERWRFGEEIDGRVRAGATIGAEAPPPPAPAADPAAVQQVAAHFPEVRACYEDRLLDRPELKGRLVLRLEVEAGVVTSAGTRSVELVDEPLQACIEAAARTWRFEADRSGIVATEVLLVP